MQLFYIFKARFIKANRTHFLWIVLLIFSKFITLSYIECNAFQTHSVYWDPDNIIFQTKPVPLLRVKPKDEIIFICAQESLYILWTYEYQVFESCSMWLNDNLMVNLLLRCPDKSTRKLQMRDSSNISKDKSTNLKNQKIMKSYSQNPFIRNQSTFTVSNSVNKKYNSTDFTVNLNRSRKMMHKRSPQSAVPHFQLNDRKKHPSQFTLLVEEFAWANGNPSFPINRPVYFLAQPSICHSRNMRLGIVNGDFTGLLPDPYVNRLFQESWLTNHSDPIAFAKQNSSLSGYIDSKSNQNNNHQTIPKNISPNEQQDQQHLCIHSNSPSTSAACPIVSSILSVNGSFKTLLLTFILLISNFILP
ncbi:unnamed protein product [Heterobilharzia americana]|nr:unnamed protein product [Heterobilharzia americana]